MLITPTAVRSATRRVCLSVLRAYRCNTGPTFSRHCYLWPWLGPLHGGECCNLVPVLWMTSCLHFAHKSQDRRHEKSIYSKGPLSLVLYMGQDAGNECRTRNIFIPAKAFARDYVITGVGLSVCLFVCLFVCLLPR